MLDKVLTLKETSLFKDSFWMLLTKVATMAAQIIYFIFVARYLGAENYGLFEGTKAIWAIVFPFIGLGMGDVLIQQVSRDTEKFSFFWGQTLLVCACSVGIALIFVFPLAAYFLPEAPWLFILLILLADVVGLKICTLSAQAFIANHKVKQSAQYGTLYMMIKLIAALFLPLFPEDNRLIAWGFLYCIGSIIPAIVLFTIVQIKFGKPTFNLKSIQFNYLRQGFFFSLSESASGINSLLDRTMLVSMSGPVSAGIYSSGYRFIDMGYMPIFAVQSASYVRFFEHGESGIRNALRFARKLLPLMLIYGALTFATLIFFAPFVPKILGEEYFEASQVLIWLSPIHLIYGLQYLAADSLTGSGFQRSRSFVQVGAAFLNISLNLYLIPIYSWKGAIWATMASEIFKVIAFWSIVLVLYIKQDERKR